MAKFDINVDRTYRECDCPPPAPAGGDETGLCYLLGLIVAVMVLLALWAGSRGNESVATFLVGVAVLPALLLWVFLKDKFN